MANYRNESLQPEMAVLKALADENRVRLLLALRAGELCVCQLIVLLDLAPSTVSKHLALLKQAGLIEARKEGRWIHYRPAAGRVAAAARSWLERLLADSAAIERDRRRLAAIREMDPEELCRLKTRS